MDKIISKIGSLVVINLSRIMFTGTLYIQFQRKKLKETVLMSNLLHLQIEIASSCREKTEVMGACHT